VHASPQRQQRLLERSARARDQGQRHVSKGQRVDRHALTSLAACPMSVYVAVPDVTAALTRAAALAAPASTAQIG
jgi:hypothetical protein